MAREREKVQLDALVLYNTHPHTQTEGHTRTEIEA